MKFLHLIKRSWRALAAHWLMTFFGLACFTASCLRLTGRLAIDMGLMAFIGSFVFGAVTFQAVGNVLSLLRLRLAFVVIAWWVLLYVSISVVVVPTLALACFAGLFALPAGALALRGRAEIFGAWPPLAYAVWGAILWINSTGKVKIWKSGAKFAVWDFYTVAILAGAVLLFLIFLAYRHALALTWWQEAGERYGGGVQKRAPRPGISGLIVVVLAAAVLCVSTAAIAPFLFRTAPAQSEGEGEPDEPKEPKKPKDPVDPQKPDVPDPDFDQMGKTIQKMMEVGTKVAKNTLPWLLMLVAFWLIGARPLRRLLLVRHLERPLWRTSPTKRIRNLWVRSLIAMDDMGCPARSDESPEDFATRAHEFFVNEGQAPPPGLEEAASIYQSVEFAGRGIQPHEADGMQIMVHKLVEWATDNASIWQKISAGYKARVRR